MKRLIIICEGPTEQEFCNNILSPFFITKNVYIQAPLIKKSKGGIVKWNGLKKEITLHLKYDSTAYVTTFFDYYGITDKFNFPNWKIAINESDKNNSVNILEKGMKSDIDSKFKFRFIPYIQLHEFEGLLFNNIETFYQQIPKNELIGIEELKSIFENYSNPELINDNKETSPSQRLSRIIKGYNKVIYGNILAESIGLAKIRNKCPRFDGWISQLEKLPKINT